MSSCQPEKNFECPICFCHAQELVQLKPCLHWFCSKCFIEWQKINKTCALCRTNFDFFEEHGTSNKRIRDIIPPRRNAPLAQILHPNITPEICKTLEKAVSAVIIKNIFMLDDYLNPRKKRRMGENFGSKKNPFIIE
jgi:hypothetical protein